MNRLGQISSVLSLLLLMVGCVSGGSKSSSAGEWGGSAGPNEPIVSSRFESNPVYPREELKSRVYARQTETFACWESAQGNVAGKRGRVVLQWVVNTSGKVSQLERLDLERTLNDPKLTECLFGIVRSVDFPIPPTGKDVIVIFPFSFVNQ